MGQTLSENNRSDLEAVFHIVTHVFDNSNLSQEIFAIDTWGAVICSLGHGRKHMLTILPTYMQTSLKDDRAFSLLHQELPQILVLCLP